MERLEQFLQSVAPAALKVLQCSGPSRAKSFSKPRGALRALKARVIKAPVDLEAVTQKIIGCAIEVHRVLGPGLLESVYRECMTIEMTRVGLRVESEVQIVLEYKGQRVGGRLRLDLLVDSCVVLEIKAVERLHPIHSAQVITYLKVSGHPAGLLMNFNATTLKGGLKRLDHPDLYIKKIS